MLNNDLRVWASLIIVMFALCFSCVPLGQYIGFLQREGDDRKGDVSFVAVATIFGIGALGLMGVIAMANVP